MTYFTFVSIIGTIGNSVILLAYGNRWNSSKSTSVIFILILACVDLWSCLIVIPTIAIIEYRDFDAPTIICRFYSFSKNLIIISSLIISFIALDRFFYIALPHYRLLTPRRVKVCCWTTFLFASINNFFSNQLLKIWELKRIIFCELNIYNWFGMSSSQLNWIIIHILIKKSIHNFSFE